MKTMATDPPEPYPLRGDHLIDEWRNTHHPASPEYQRVVFFVRRLMTDPDTVPCLTRPALLGLPEHTMIVPDTDTQVTWIVLRSPPYSSSMRSVELIDIRPAPLVG